MKKKLFSRLTALTLTLVMLTALLTGCGSPASTTTPAPTAPSSAAPSATPSGEPADSTTVGKIVPVTADTVSAKDTLVFGVNASASGMFHPTLQYSNNDREVVFLVFDRLVTKDAEGNYVPSLCESYEVSPDSKVYTFKLKQGIKWQDGEEFTAEDVAYTYETTCHPDFGKGYDEFSALLEGSEAYHTGKADHVSGIQVIDPYTVSFTFSAPYMDAMVKFIDKPVLAKHVWEPIPVGQWGDATDLLKNPVGTGPYKVIEFVPDQYVKLERNENYFKGAPLIKYFILKVSNRDTRQAEMVNGNLDLTIVTSWRDDGTKLYADNNIPIGEQTESNSRYLVCDTTDERLSDVRVRQALVYAIDREALIKGLVNGHGNVSNALMQPSQAVYPTEGLNDYKYDPEKAKALLKEAGWEDTNNDGIVDKDGKNLTLTLQYSDNHQLAQAVQQYAKTSGIDIELINQDFNTVLATLKTSTEKFDLAFMGATYRPNPGYGGSNTWMARFDKDPKEIELLKAATSSSNLDEAKSNYAAWCQYINEQVPMFILYFDSEGYAFNPKLVNYSPVRDEWYPNVEQWYFEG